MYDYPDELSIDDETFKKCDFNIIDEELLKFGSGYKLVNLIKYAEGEQDEQLTKLYKLLTKVCSLRLKNDNTVEPYVFIDRSSVSEAFTENDLKLLDTIRVFTSCNAFAARISDLRWLYCRPKSINDAHNAIDLYSCYEINENNWINSVKNYYERASILSIQLGKGCIEKIEKIKQSLNDALAIEYPNSKFMKLWIAELLDLFYLEQKRVKEIADDFVDFAEKLMIKNDYYSARLYLEHSAEKFIKNKDNENWVNTRIKIAESWSKEAEYRDSGLVQMTFYENAIQAYRMIPKSDREKYNIDETISTLRLKLRDSGKAAINEMVPISIDGPDVSDIVEQSITHVSGKKNVDLALLYFCGLHPGISKTRSIDSAVETAKLGFISNIFGSVQLSGDGRKIGKEDPLMYANQIALEEIPISKAVENAVRDADFIVGSKLLPALSAIENEHIITLKKLETICTVSPLIPEKRAKLFARGLYFGFEYDFSSAIHLLVPQWEHMVRIMMKENDVHTTVLDPEGIDMECGLSTLLDKKEASEIFDDNLLFEMIAFLTHKRGPNLRNELAHGLLDDHNSSSYSAVYWWWRSLKFVVNSLVHRVYTETDNEQN